MGTPHVCFADAPQYRDPEAMQRSNASPNSVSPTPRYERNMGFFQQLSRRFGLRSNDDLVYSVEDDTHSSSTDSCSSTVGTVPPLQSSSSRSNSNSMPNAHTKDLQGSSTEHISCASSETSSTVDIDDQLQQQQQQPSASTGTKDRKSATRSSFSRLHRRSTSSLRRAFESFSLSSRSLSCSGATPTPQRDVTNSGSSNNNSSCSSSSTPIKSVLKASSNGDLHRKTSSSTSASLSSSKKSKSKPPPQRILRQPVSYTYLKGISGLPTQRVPRNSVCCQYARR